MTQSAGNLSKLIKKGNLNAVHSLFIRFSTLTWFTQFIDLSQTEGLAWKLHLSPVSSNTLCDQGAFLHPQAAFKVHPCKSTQHCSVSKRSLRDLALFNFRFILAWRATQGTESSPCGSESPGPMSQMKIDHWLTAKMSHSRIESHLRAWDFPH